MSDQQPTSSETTFNPNSVAVSYEELDKAGVKSKSQIIRYLNSLGYSRAAIAKFLNVKYQHVRNVLVAPLKRQIKAERDAAKAAQQSSTANQPTMKEPTDEELERASDDLDDEGSSVLDGKGPVFPRPDLNPLNAKTTAKKVIRRFK